MKIPSPTLAATPPDPNAANPAEPPRPLHPYDLDGEAPGILRVLLIRSVDKIEVVTYRAVNPDTGEQESIPVPYKRREYPKGYQNYVCDKCGVGQSNGMLDEGVTPFLVACQQPGCTGRALGQGQHPEPTHDCTLEWYFPGRIARDTIRRKDAVLFDHIRRGGLDRRHVAEYVCSLCTRKINRNKPHAFMRVAGREEEPREPMCAGCCNRHQPSKKRAGRNELCPCGSGKKFKACCAKPN